MTQIISKLVIRACVLTLCGGAALLVTLPIASKARTATRLSARTTQDEQKATRIRKLKEEAALASLHSRHSDAISLNRAILDLSPHDLGAYAALGKSYDALGYRDLAIKSFRTAFLTRFPNVYGGVWDPYARYRFGELSTQIGNLDVARESFSASLTGAQEVAGGITPQCSSQASTKELEALSASTLVNHAQLVDRLAAAKHAYDLFPDSVYVACVYAWNLYVRNQYGDARAIYDHAISLASPSDKVKISSFVRALNLNRQRLVLIEGLGKQVRPSGAPGSWNGPLNTPSFTARPVQHRPTNP